MTRSQSLPTVLLRWFDAHQRTLPWRANRDAYRIWVSEVMLQQTTVAAVVGYYDPFLKAFPTVQSLAKAPLQKVLRQWEGLGYYRRARHLHAAAKIIVARHSGEFPCDPAEAAKLPGVGRYILGAVLSQAYEVRLPIVEANSLRVLARWTGEREDPRRGDALRRIWQVAEWTLPRRRVGDFNQALMELGALVCTPVAPKCDDCPVRRHCVAHREDLQDAIPPAKVPPVVVRRREVAAVIRRKHRILLGCRTEHAVRGAGLWEVPHGEWKAGESAEDAARRIAKSLTGLSVAVGPELLTLQHTVTRHAITVTALEATATGRLKSKTYSELRWCSPNELSKLPASTPQRTILREATNPARQKRLF